MNISYMKCNIIMTPFTFIYTYIHRILHTIYRQNFEYIYTARKHCPVQGPVPWHTVQRF